MYIQVSTRVHVYTYIFCSSSWERPGFVFINEAARLFFFFLQNSITQLQSHSGKHNMTKSADSLLNSPAQRVTDQYGGTECSAEDGLITKPVEHTSDLANNAAVKRQTTRKRKCVVCCLCCVTFVLLSIFGISLFLVFCDCAPLIRAVASEVFQSKTKDPPVFDLPGMV